MNNGAHQLLGWQVLGLQCHHTILPGAAFLPDAIQPQHLVDATPCRPVVMVSWATLRPVRLVARCRCLSPATTFSLPLRLVGSAPAPSNRLAQSGAGEKHPTLQTTSPLLRPLWWTANTRLLP